MIHCVCFVVTWQLLLNESVDAGLRDADGLSPAMWACHFDRVEHVNLLNSYKQQQKVTAHQQDSHDRCTDDYGYESDLCGRTLLHWSVRQVEPLQCLKVCLYETVSAHKLCFWWDTSVEQSTTPLALLDTERQLHRTQTRAKAFLFNWSWC